MIRSSPSQAHLFGGPNRVQRSRAGPIRVRQHDGTFDEIPRISRVASEPAGGSDAGRQRCPRGNPRRRRKAFQDNRKFLLTSEATACLMAERHQGHPFKQSKVEYGALDHQIKQLSSLEFLYSLSKLNRFHIASNLLISDFDI